MVKPVSIPPGASESNGPLTTFLVTAAIAIVLIVVVLVWRRRRPQAVET